MLTKSILHTHVNFDGFKKRKYHSHNTIVWQVKGSCDAQPKYRKYNALKLNYGWIYERRYAQNLSRYENQKIHKWENDIVPICALKHARFPT